MSGANKLMHFLDTNIFLYSISDHPAEERKHSLAIELLDRGDGALSVQVLQEFYVQATRTTRAKALPHDIAVALMRTWTRFAIQDITVPIMDHALHIKQHYRLSYWDSAVVAAASALGCTTLYSEDLQHGQQIDALRICNPFL
jgi:predicted nucleic acid-binding protein